MNAGPVPTPARRPFAGWADPLLIKELRTRLRARTMLVVQLLYIIGICGVVFLGFLFVADDADKPGWELGRSLFKTITYVQALLVFFTAPLIAAAAISGEREEKTFDSLCVTPLSPGRLVLTKLTAALAAFAVLVCVSLPFACVSFILGGVAPRAIALAYVLTLLTTLAAGALGLFWSARFERSIAAIPAAAVCVVLILVAGQWLNKTGLAALAGVSPLVALGRIEGPGARVAFFGVGCPSWLPAVAFLLTGTAYLLTAAAGRLRFEVERRYVAQRLLGLLLFGLLVVFVGGALAAPVHEPARGREQVAGLLRTIFALLALLAPWIGANRRVALSERAAPRRTPAARLAARILTGPVAFMLLLAAVAVPVLGISIRLGGRLNLAPALLWLTIAAGAGAAPPAYAALALALADRRRVWARHVGLGAACILMLVLMLAPPAAEAILRARAAGPVAPAAAQWAALISPITIINALGEAGGRSPALPAVMDALGPRGAVLATGGLQLGLLALCLLPRAFRRRGPA